ncbi:hypothetical protein FNV43_RR13124 [Rhamnella rubrinervis]|uniref:DUF7815 domain-containing protein n=1 Tax=Rhamnella rubrinervis TaxID=2594499 RepID=A0A8K0H0I4_9ROSA|nr:hypothetical protein FNV43_RR13124 [Rhamnella rubrinervis]
MFNLLPDVASRFVSVSENTVTLLQLNIWKTEKESESERERMAMDIPFEQINQLQISLRKSANLSSYDPDDPSFHNLPSAEEAIAELDPSPLYLRCKHCKGRLLRGVQSLICVFCGREACKDVPPDPINFQNTIGYRWLLESLKLDGSEIVEPPIEANNSNRGQAAPKEEIPLSDLLDLEITWFSQSEKFGTTFSNETPVQSKISLNLAGVSLENFFDKVEKDGIFNASEESAAPNKQIVSKENIQGHDNLNLFENVRPSETAVPSMGGESSYSDSGWGADFQSAASGAHHEESTSYDPFVNATVDLSVHMDDVFGPGKDSIDRKEREMTGSASMANDWFEDDLWSGSKSGLTSQPEEFKKTANVKDGHLMGNVNTYSSTTVDWVQENQWQSSSNEAPDNKNTSADVDLFDGWNDFTSTTRAQNSSSSSWKQTTMPSNDQTSELNLFSSSNHPEDTNFGSLSQPDLFSGNFGSSNGSTEGNKIQSGTSALDRTSEANAIDGGISENFEKGGAVSIVKTSSKPDDVETLLSQMHDLSFMLDSNLSIPPNQGGLNSSSQG